MNRRLKSKGFTLIELIIVIAIIALLAAIAIPKFMKLRENSNRKADLSVAKNLHTIVCSMISDGKIDINSLPTNPMYIVVDESITSTDTKTVLDTYYEQPKIKSNAIEGLGNAYVVAVYRNGGVEIIISDKNSPSLSSGNRIYPNCNIDDPDGDGKLF